jgi:aminoglycoside/choline kinase family phosphotransferase
MIPLPKIIADIYHNYSGEEPQSVVQLPATASDRLYFRVTAKNDQTVIATHSTNIRENRSFIALANHFASHGLNVPCIVFSSNDDKVYLQDDLGDVSLFSMLQQGISEAGVTEEVRMLYFNALQQLARFQFKASENLDYSHCYPVAEFDKTSMLWDLNYFKYYFLKPSGIHFEEDLLEADFHTLIDALLKDQLRYFMFRDFQSRNIMIRNNTPWLIDFQGGRKGPVLYDLASCILDAKANLPHGFRNELKEHYYSLIPHQIRPDRKAFEKSLGNCMLIRILQAFGAYGFRGMIQKKTLFLQSIPYAAANLRHLLTSGQLTLHLSHLYPLLEQITEKYNQALTEKKSEKLTIRIFSFSYKRGIPEDITINGGGFVFDCRSLPNPGRIPEMQTKTGFDREVQQLLMDEHAVGKFLSATSQIVFDAVNNYLERGFSDLMVSYGCTGGQHRSVFCANFLSEILKNKYLNSDVIIDVTHRELIR